MRIQSASLALALAFAGCVDDDATSADGVGGAGGEAPVRATGAQLAACIGLDEGAPCIVDGTQSVCEAFPNGIGCPAEGMPGAGGMGGAGGMPDAGGMAGAGGMQMPPDEAFAACEGVDLGAVCTFEGMMGEAVDGTCITAMDGRPVCRPEMGGMGGAMGEGGEGGAPPEGGMGGMGGAPPEDRPNALACAELNPGDMCSFVRRDGEEINGDCRLNEDGLLVCRPGMAPPDGGMGEGGMGGAPDGGVPDGGAPDGGAGGEGGAMAPPAATAACADLVEGAECMFMTPGGEQLNGTCRLTPSDALACVP